MITCPKIHRPDCAPADIRALFDDDHVHLALVVTEDGQLLTTVERADLTAVDSAGAWSRQPASVAGLGTLVDRTVGPSEALDAVTATLVRSGRRRLAVIGDSGRLVGLLCLKRDRSGYCTDDGVAARVTERAHLEHRTRVPARRAHIDGRPA